jgi:hypothetical protein
MCLRTGCRGEYLDLRGRKWWEAAENCIMRSFVTCVIRKSCPCALTEHHTLKAYWGSGDIAPHILTSALDGGEWSASHPVHNLYASQDIFRVKENEIGGTCSTHGRVEKCIKYFGWKT